MKHFIVLFLLTVFSIAESTDEQLVEQWLLTEQLISEEAEDWKLEQAHTGRLLELYGKELTLLDEELSKSGKNVELVDNEAETLKQKIAASEGARKELIRFLSQLVPEVLALYQKLPPPLQEQLSEQAFTLENQVNNATVDVILQAVVKVFQDSERFNRSFVFEEHAIELVGISLRAKVLYFGLSHAVFEAGNRYGEASPSSEGWVFSEREGLKNGVKKAFDVQEKKIASSLFAIPLTPTQ